MYESRVAHFLYIYFIHYVFIMVTSLEYPETSPEINRNRGTSVLEPDIVSIICFCLCFFFVCFFVVGRGAEAAISQESNSCEANNIPRKSNFMADTS